MVRRPAGKGKKRKWLPWSPATSTSHHSEKKGTKTRKEERQGEGLELARLEQRGGGGGSALRTRKKKKGGRREIAGGRSAAR